MIRIITGAVMLSEQTLNELVKAVEKARDEIEFTDEPMPRTDMTAEQFVREKARRGEIQVESPHSGISFVIQLPRWDREQERLRYRLVGI